MELLSPFTRAHIVADVILMDIRVLKILLYNLVIYRDNINHESKTYYKIVFMVVKLEIYKYIFYANMHT